MKTLKSGPNKIKAFFQRQQWKEVLIFFAFVLLSFGFWILQSLQEVYEIKVSIPVRYRNMPVDVSFTEPAPDKIVVTLKDKGSILMNYVFGRKFTPIETSFKTKSGQTKSGTITVAARQIESDIQKQLIATTKLVKIEPTEINAKYAQRAHKEIPVEFNGKVNLEPGFQLSGDIRSNPAFVTVYATEAAFDSLPKIQTAYTEFKSVNKTVSKVVQLKKTAGISYDPETVTLTIPVDEYSEKTLEIPVECTNIPSRYTVRLLPHTVKVSCNIPISRFKELTADQFVIRIPFSALEQNLTGVTAIELSQKPNWVTVATLSPNRIEFVIEQNTSAND